MDPFETSYGTFGNGVQLVRLGYAGIMKQLQL